MLSVIRIPVNVGFCTLAIHPPYRQRARRLCAGTPNLQWTVLTDEPADFADLNVRAIPHQPTGPMALDYLARLPMTGDGRGAAAYHDKRFALAAALDDCDTAIYVDADSQIKTVPALKSFPPGLAVLPVVEKSVAQHLVVAGTWRLPTFVELAQTLTGDADTLHRARWCHEAVLAITRDGNESRFFQAWDLAADFLQSREVYSGEGGVIGLAAHHAGWDIDYKSLHELGSSIEHEGGGPKNA